MIGDFSHESHLGVKDEDFPVLLRSFLFGFGVGLLNFSLVWIGDDFGVIIIMNFWALIFWTRTHKFAHISKMV